MIWIRSQKKTALVEVSHVRIYEELSKGEVTSCSIIYDTPDVAFELGVYSTKEKALKVLDMIQEYIGGLKKLDLIANMTTRAPHHFITVDANEYVLQMPQDDEVVA